MFIKHVDKQNWINNNNNNNNNNCMEAGNCLISVLLYIYSNAEKSNN